MIGTKTAANAHLRIIIAEMGSLSNNPSDEYLESLRHHLSVWLARVDRVIAGRAKARGVQEQNPKLDVKPQLWGIAFTEGGSPNGKIIGWKYYPDGKDITWDNKGDALEALDRAGWTGYVREYFPLTKKV